MPAVGSPRRALTRTLARFGALRAALAVVLGRGRTFKADDQPGAEVFPKRVFELDRAQTPLSERPPAAYFQLVRTLWRMHWSAAPRGSSDAPWLRRMHDDVMLAHQLEREAVDRLDGPS